MEMALVWTSHHLDAAMAGRLFLERPYWRPLSRNYLGVEPGVASLCGMASRALAFS